MFEESSQNSSKIPQNSPSALQKQNKNGISEEDFDFLFEDSNSKVDESVYVIKKKTPKKKHSKPKKNGLEDIIDEGFTLDFA